MKALAVFILLLAVPAAAAPRKPPKPPVDEPRPETRPTSQPVLAPIERGYNLDDLGLGREVRRDAGRGSVTLSLPTRADWVLTSAKIIVVFSSRAPDPLLSGIEVLVNNEHVGTFDATQLAKTGIGHAIDIDPAFLADHNTVTLHVIRAAVGACEGRVPVGTWDVIARGRVELRAAPLRQPNDLAGLPLPFTDTDFGSDAAVPMAFLNPPTAEHLRAAAMVASWFGLHAGGKLRFPVTIGELPAGDAVVFVDGPETANKLGVPAPTGPSLTMMDMPSGAGTRKLLVVAGRTPEELTAAARALAHGAPLTGASVVFGPPGPEPALAAPYDAPRWLPATGERLLLSKIPGAGALELHGAGGGTIRLEFRLPPDLFFWQTQQPSIEVGWSATMPPGAHAPHVTIELNGHYIGVVPVTRSSHGSAIGRHRLIISDDTLPGYNEVLIHVDYGHMACGAEAAPALFTVDPDAALFLGDHPTHFVTYPNVALFVDDGFPFTRIPDLSETAVVVPPKPRPGEIETMLSVMAHFAAVTGRTGTGILVVQPDTLQSAAGRDLLIVGAADNDSLLVGLSDKLPLVFPGGRPFAQRPYQSTLQIVLTWLSGRDSAADAERAEELTSHDPGLAAAMAIESPLDKGRAAVILTAASDARMPLLRDLQGPAVSSSREDDLLVESRGALWMFRLGPSYDVGQLDDWRRFLLFLSRHWVALFPFVLVGTLGLAAVLRSALRERVRIRRAQIGDLA